MAVTQAVRGQACEDRQPGRDADILGRLLAGPVAAALVCGVRNQASVEPTAPRTPADSAAARCRIAGQSHEALPGGRREQLAGYRGGPCLQRFAGERPRRIDEHGRSGTLSVSGIPTVGGRAEESLTVV